MKVNAIYGSTYKDLLKENKQLKELKYKFFDNSGDEESFTLEDYLEIGNKLYDYEEENKQLKSILTELEEWLKGRIEWNKSILKEDAGKSDLLGINFHRKAYIKVWEDTLDKIQELKEKYK